MMLTRIFFYPFLFLYLFFAGAPYSASIAQAQTLPTTPGWHEIPATKLRSVCPPNGYGGSGYGFADNCGAVTAAWNSAVLDSKRNRLIIWGGGHADYFGNELYGLDLNSLTMQRLTDPGLPLATFTACPEALTNGTQPNSRHTYDGLTYMANVDRMFVFGGALTTCGWFSAGTWTFNFATSQWEKRNPTGPIPRADPGIVSAYDPNTGKVFLHDSLDLYTYSYWSDSYQKLTNNGSGIDYHLTGVIDPVRKKFVMIGARQAWIYDIGPGSSYIKQPLSTSGGSAIVNSSYPGLAYDSVTDRIVAWNGGNTVYSLNLSTNSWTAIANYSGGPGTANSNGTYKRWSYSSASGVFVVVNSADQNAFTFRLSPADSGTPSPPPTDVTPPSIPSGLTGTVESSSQISISWNASMDNVGVTGYRVYREGIQIASVSSTSYTDSNLSPSTQYSYKVSAYDSAGNFSAQSSAVSAITLGPVAPPAAVTPTLLVKFGKTSAFNTFGLSGWSSVIKDVYTDYQDIGPGGTTIVVGDNYTYNYQGISGSTRNFTAGDKVRVTWYNNSATTVTLTPNISFNDPDRITMGVTGAWYPMTVTSIPSSESAISEYTFTSATAGSYSLVNINVNYINTRTIVADKIELFPVGTATSSFDFALSNGGNKTVAQGQSVSNSITADLVSGTAQLVNLSIAGLPSGAAVTIAQNSCTPTCSTSMNIATSASSATGIYPITISGSSGSVSQTSNFNLTITAGTSIAPSTPSQTPAPNGGIITYFLLTSPVSQQDAPFTLGQPFRQGDVPSGSSVVASIPGFQSSVKTRWPDGSVQFAILSGRADLQANTPLRIDLSAGSAPTGVALTEQDLQSEGGNMQLSFSGIGIVELSSLIGKNGTYSTALNRWSAGKVLDWITGPEMSSWIYSSPIGSDNSLSAWFEVRLWKGGRIEILPWIENGYLNKPGVTEKNGTATLSISGSQRFSNLFRVLHHTRSPLVSGATQSYWTGTDPQVSFKHDTGYIQKSKLVPTYGAITPSNSPALASLALSYTPFGQANYPGSIGTAGYHPSIGLLPQWDVLYLTTGGDSRALAAVSVNAYSAGRYSIHYRDEKTNRPLKISSYPNLVIKDPSVPSTGSSSLNTYTPTSGGGSPPAWATSHAPSVGYMAYLLYGRFYFMEESQFAATLVFLKQTDSTRQFSKGILETAAGANTTRGAGWGLRTYAQAAIATPDNDLLKQEFTGTVDHNIVYYHSRYIGTPNNAHGIAQPYSDYTPGDNIYMHAIWMEDFLTAAMGYILDAKANTVAVKSEATILFSWKAQSAIGRLGQAGVSTEYDFRDAAQYNIAVAPTDNANWTTGAGPWYANWGDLYRATMGTTAGTARANELRGGNFPESTSYWGNFQPAIAYAVTNNVPGASPAYARMTGASNWAQFFDGFKNAPEWSVVPSNSDVSTPDGNTRPPSAPSNLSLR